MLIIDQLLEINLSESEKLVADYIIKHKDEISNISINKLAKYAYSSNPTIIRLCRKLGLSGYKEFKIKFSSQLEIYYKGLNDVNPDFPFTQKDSIKEITNKICILTKETVDQCYHSIDVSILNDISETIIKSKNIYIYAVGDSMIRAMAFQNRLLKIKILSVISSQFQEERYYAKNATDEDCAIFITYGGNELYNQLLQAFKDKGTKTIVISANRKSVLSESADYFIEIPQLEAGLAEYKIATFASQISIDYIFNSLYSCIFEKNYEENMKYIRSTNPY